MNRQGQENLIDLHECTENKVGEKEGTIGRGSLRGGCVRVDPPLPFCSTCNILNTNMHPNLKNGSTNSSQAAKHEHITTTSLPQQDTTRTESHKAPYSRQQISTSTYTISQLPQTQTRPSGRTPMTLLSCQNTPNTRQQQLTYYYT